MFEEPNKMIVDIDNDVRYIHMKSLVGNIAYTIYHHLDIWHKYALARTPDLLNSEDNVFNRCQISEIWNKFTLVDHNVSDSKIELTNQEFDAVVNTLYNRLIDSCSHVDIVKYVKRMTSKDKAYIVFYMYSVFFIPCRVEISTIPPECYIESLRKWINIAFVTPLMPKFFLQFDKSIVAISSMESYINKLRDDKDIINKITSQNVEYISTITSNMASPKGGTIMIKTLTLLTLIVSTKILHYWCPNIQHLHTINPNYDGKWINPLDQMINKQVVKIDDMGRECYLAQQI